MDLTAPTLTGRLVRLEPLTRDHIDGLVEAVRDGELWTRWYANAPRPDEVASQVETRLAMQERGQMVPFACVRRSDGQVLGTTAYYDINHEVPRLSIGYTWNRASTHGTGTNPDSKLLLLEHAFDTLGVEAVRFHTSWHNQQSRAAIERLGARQDGVLRADTRHRDGTLRDTVAYSILAHEWPAVRATLRARLSTR